MTLSDGSAVVEILEAVETAEQAAERLTYADGRGLVLYAIKRLRDELGYYQYRAKRAQALCVAFFLLGSTAMADNTKEAQNAANCVCREPSNGAREGEPIRDRIARLEQALRLAKAEALVNRKRK